MSRPDLILAGFMVLGNLFWIVAEIADRYRERRWAAFVWWCVCAAGYVMFAARLIAAGYAA